MRISGKPSGVGSTQSATGPKASGASASAPVASVSGSDAVQVSSEARLVAVAQEALAVVPDIRMEKVEALTPGWTPTGRTGEEAEGLIKEHMAKGRHS